MRLFTALDLPPDILLLLERLLAALRPEAAVTWSPLDNLHITTKFIGEWPEERLEEIDKRLHGLALTPIDIELRDMGWYPNADSPRVLWAGVHAGDSLKNLAAGTEEALLPLGIARDPHEYSPHLTLARIKHAVPLGRLRVKVEELHNAPICKFRSSNFYLYRSDPGSNASIYRKIRTYPINRD
jgi:2'-5' RNA ligase